MHRVFGYRGVILFPWLAKVYDRDVPNKREVSNVDGNVGMNVGKEVKGRTHTFYQVLIDSRDCPYIVRYIFYTLLSLIHDLHCRINIIFLLVILKKITINYMHSILFIFLVLHILFFLNNKTISY